ncbi:hypothetical protein Peur_015128 [Populus x canadensis]
MGVPFRSSLVGLDSSHSQASPIAVASSSGLSPISSPVMAISPAGSPSWFVPILSSSVTCSSSVSPHGINESHRRLHNADRKLRMPHAQTTCAVAVLVSAVQ